MRTKDQTTIKSRQNRAQTDRRTSPANGSGVSCALCVLSCLAILCALSRSTLSLSLSLISFQRSSSPYIPVTVPLSFCFLASFFPFPSLSHTLACALTNAAPHHSLCVRRLWSACLVGCNPLQPVSLHLRWRVRPSFLFPFFSGVGLFFFILTLVSFPPPFLPFPYTRLFGCAFPRHPLPLSLFVCPPPLLPHAKLLCQQAVSPLTHNQTTKTKQNKINK
jgi:hypothetical protein